jgi:hypothetical protein
MPVEVNNESFSTNSSSLYRPERFDWDIARNSAVGGDKRFFACFNLR